MADLLKERPEEVSETNTLSSFYDFQTAIGEAMTFLLSQDALHSAEAVTLESSLLDAIFELDTAPDIVDVSLDHLATSDDGNVFSSGILSTHARLGKLQRIRLIRIALFGGQYTDSNGEVQTLIGTFDTVAALPGAE
jgi:hypothetical protein